MVHSVSDHLFCNRFSRKVQKSGSRKVVLQTLIFFSGQPLFSNQKKCRFFLEKWLQNKWSTVLQKDVQNIYHVRFIVLCSKGGGIIMGVTRLLLLGPFYYIQTICSILFCTRLYNRLIESLQTVKKRAPLIILVLLICYDLHHGLSVGVCLTRCNFCFWC